MIEKFFLDSEHAGMGGSLSPKKVVCLFILNAWFLKINLLDYDFVVVYVQLNN